MAEPKSNSTGKAFRRESRLTAVAVKQLKSAGRYSDGQGLYLQITPKGTKSWIFRYERGGGNGKRGSDRMMGLGPVHTVSLAQARELAAHARQMLLKGRDPLDLKRSEKADALSKAASSLTFGECAERYIALQQDVWRNQKHRRQWPSSLKSYAGALMPMDVSEICTQHMREVLLPIWTTKVETANRVRGRIERILDWATANGYRSGENPACLRGNLSHLLPKQPKRVKHHGALPYAEVPALMSKLRPRQDISAKALEFTILTAARTNEVTGARWAEFDLEGAAWTLPAERMKAGREHRVPLCERAVQILRSLHREGDCDFVFVRPGAKAPITNNTMLRALKHMERNATVHGVARSCFRDWAAETTAYPAEICEQALAHAAGKLERAYRRGDIFNKRRRLMDDWAAYCASPSRNGEVVPLRATS